MSSRVSAKDMSAVRKTARENVHQEEEEELSSYHSAKDAWLKIAPGMKRKLKSHKIQE